MRLSSSMRSLTCALACLLLFTAGRPALAWPEAETGYGDPILFPGHRQDNLVELELAPVLDGEMGPIAGLHVNFHVSEAVSWLICLGKYTAEWRHTYAYPSDFEKTYTIEMRSRWGDPMRSGASNFSLTLGFDWTSWGEEGYDDFEQYALSIAMGYGLEFRPVTGLSLELFVGFGAYVFDLSEEEEGGWEDVVLHLTPALKISYEIFKGGHPVIEMRFPLVVLQPGDDLEDSDGILGDMFSMDLAIGYRQNLGPFTGGLYFVIGVYGDSFEYFRERDTFAMVFDLGMSFF